MKADLVKTAAPAAVPDSTARSAAPTRPVEVTLPGANAAAAANESVAQASSDETRAAVREANRKLAEKNTELTIEFDDDLGRMIFTLVDTQTREVVRQIPSEEVLAIARALADDKSAGVLLRGNA